MNCIFLFFKGQSLILHKACVLVQVFLLWQIIEWLSLLSVFPAAIWHNLDLAFCPCDPGCMSVIQSTKWRSTSYYKKPDKWKKSLLLLSDCWPESTVIHLTLGAQITVCQPMYGNTYNKWVRLMVIFNCSGASIFKALWNKKGTILILLLKLILMNSMTWTQTMKNTRLLDETTNITRIDRWQIVIERQT